MWDKPSNVANESGDLEPHMDMSPYESQPGLIILQCIRYRKQCKTEDLSNSICNVRCRFHGRPYPLGEMIVLRGRGINNSGSPGSA